MKKSYLIWMIYLFAISSCNSKQSDSGNGEMGKPTSDTTNSLISQADGIKQKMEKLEQKENELRKRENALMEREKAPEIGSAESDIIGEWGDCSGYSPSEKITITIKGSALILHRRGNDYVLKKISNELYSTDGGTVTLAYKTGATVAAEDNYREKVGAHLWDSLVNTPKIHEALKKAKWYVSGLSEKNIELCRLNVLS